MTSPPRAVGRCLLLCAGFLLLSPWPVLAGSISPESLAAAARYSRETGHSGLEIRQNNRILFQETAEGITRDTLFPAFSITKSLFGILALCAERDGILDLGDPVRKFLPAWEHSETTLEELLSFPRGLPSGREVFYGSPRRSKRELAARFAPGSGSGFHYGPAAYEIFGEILRRALQDHGTTPLAYLHDRLLRPIGASQQGWRKAPACGEPFFSTGARMTLGQMISLGELLRRDGRVGFRRIWRAGGRNRLSTANADFPIYAMGIWRNLAAKNPEAVESNIIAEIGQETDRAKWTRKCLSHHAPPDLLAMIGSGGQRVYVIPSMGITIARTGSGSERFRDARFFEFLFSE